MESTFTLVAIALCLAAAVVFYRAVKIEQVRPRIVTWYAWAVVNAMASMAMYSDGHYPATAFAAAVTLTALWFGFVAGRRSPTAFRQIDAVIQIGVLISIGLWVFFNSPAIAVVVAVGLDALVGLPIVRHYLNYPAKKLLLSYVLWSLAAMAAVAGAGAWSVTAVAFPLYAVGFNVLAAIVIYLRRQRASEPQFTNVEEV